MSGPNDPSPHPRRSPAWALLLLTLTALGVRLAWLAQSAEPTGTDGFYYLVQIQDFAAGAGLHVADSSWVLRLLGALGWVLSPLWAHKLGGALLAAAAVPAGWWAGERVRPGGGWAVALLVALSPTLTHLAGDFAKNLGMVAPLLLWLGGLLSPPQELRGWLLPLLGGVLAAWAHRLGAAMVLLSLLGAVAARTDRRLLSAGALGTLGLLGLSQVSPGLLGLADLDRLQGTLDLAPHFPQPWPLVALRDTNPIELAEWSLAWPALAASLTMGRRWWPLALPLAVVLLLPWELRSLDMGYRLVLVAPVLLWPLAAMLPPPPAWTLLLLPLSVSGLDPQEHPPYARYRQLLQALPRQPELLIAHQGMNFLYDYERGAPAMAWAPEPELDRAGIGRVAVGIEPGQWPKGEHIVPLGVGPGGLRYVYVQESTWERLSESKAPELRAQIERWQNPTRVRPASLSLGRQP